MTDQQVHPEPKRLRDFSLGKLSPSEVDDIERHLADCPPCCETLAGVSEDTFVSLVRHAQTEPASAGTQPPVSQPDADLAHRPTLPPSAGTTPPGESHAPASRAASDHPAGGAPGSNVIPGNVVRSLRERNVNSLRELTTLAVPRELEEHPRYHVQGLLGSGGMGAVYKAEHRVMQRIVALKVINPNLTQHHAAVERFQREVRAAARLNHPNIVTAHDAESAGSVHFMVMEYVDGTDLSDLLNERGPLPVAEACEYVRQAAVGLEHAYEQGMVHRDIKPQNLMLTPDGQVKILDFGLAHFASEVGTRSGLTEQGSIMGTPDYMAPEQARDARKADIRADIYSLGCTLYTLLTGQPPFPDGSTIEKVMAHTEQEPQPMSHFRNDIAPELDAIVKRMMAKLPEQRFQTPAEVADALAAFAESIGRAAAGGSAVEKRQSQPARIESRPVAPDASDRRHRGRHYWLVGAAAAAVLLLAGIIYVSTDAGQLKIESFTDDVQIVVTKGGEEYTIIDLKTDSKVRRFRSGEYEISVKGRTDVKLDRTGFTMTRGGEQIVKVAPAVTTAQKTDANLIQGTWVVQSAERSGRPLSREQAAMQEITFDGVSMRAIMPDGEKKTGFFKLDSDKSPKQITIFDKDENQGFAGIYRLDGDQLTLCWNQNPSRAVPERFVTNVGTAADLLVFNRRPMQTGNLMGNPGFEDSVDPQGRQPALWMAERTTLPSEPEAECYRDTETKFRGDASGAVVKQESKSAAPEAGFVQKIVRLPAGKNLRLSGYLKTKDLDGSAYMVLRILDTQKSLTPVAWCATPSISGTSDWQEYEAYIRTPERADGMLGLVMRGKGTVWFDEISLQEVADAGAEQNALTAEQILQRMAKRYAECRSYRDTGVVTEALIRDQRKRIDQKPFRTAFVRPDRFRYEFNRLEYDPPQRYIVWRNGQEILTWWDVKPGINSMKSFELAVGAAAGVSSGSSYDIPSLLLPDEVGGGRPLTKQLTTGQRIGDAVLPNRECYRIQGEFAGSRITLWIEKQSFLVYRIETRRKFEDFQTETTTDYNPAIDEEIPEKLLEFDAPSSSERGIRNDEPSTKREGTAQKKADKNLGAPHDPGHQVPELTPQDRLQGKWVPVSGHLRNKPLTDEQLARMSITFDGHRAELVAPDGDGQPQTGTFEIDAKRKPMFIDFIAPGGKERAPGIFAFDGERLKLAFIDGDYARPTDFEPSGAPDHLTATLERAPVEGGALGADEQHALKAAEEFLAVMDAGRFGQLFDMCSTLAKQHSTREQVSRSQQALRDTFGKATHRVLQSVRVFDKFPGLPDSHYAGVQYKSTYERKDGLWESLLLTLESDGTWRVNTYGNTLEPLRFPASKKPSASRRPPRATGRTPLPTPPSASPEDKPRELTVKEQAALKAAREWLKLVDAGKYGDAWEACAEFAKKADDKEKLVAIYNSFRPALGKVVERKLLSAVSTESLPGAPDGQYVLIQFKTRFENKQQAFETVVPMLEKDGQWRVSGYHVN